MPNLGGQPDTNATLDISLPFFLPTCFVEAADQKNLLLKKVRTSFIACYLLVLPANMDVFLLAKWVEV